MNPAAAGTGNLDDYLAIAGTVGAVPPWVNRTRLPAPLASPNEPRRPKPPFPPPVDEVRLTNRKGKDSPHPSHVPAEATETAHAKESHARPSEVVIRWGKRMGKQGDDKLVYDMDKKIIIFDDSKYRGDEVMIRPSKTFTTEKRLAAAILDAEAAIDKSSLSPADKAAARLSIKNGTFQTRTLGAGKAKNSTFGDHHAIRPDKR